MFTLCNKRDKRRKTIAGYAEIDIQLGVLLAAVDFEWTCRRAILALSKNPTVTIRQKFSTDYRSFGGLKIGWEKQIKTLSASDRWLLNVILKKLLKKRYFSQLIHS